MFQHFEKQLKREIYGDRCCSQCSTMWVVVPWKLRYSPEPMEVGDNCVSLEPECLNVGQQPSVASAPRPFFRDSDLTTGVQSRIHRN